MKFKEIRTFVLLLIGVVYMFNSYGCAQQVKYEKYTSKDPEINISVDYISGWLYSEQRGANDSFAQVVFYQPKKKGEVSKAGITITVEKSPKVKFQPQTIDAMADDLISKRLKFKDSAVISKSNTKFMATDACDIQLTYKTLEDLLAMTAKLIAVKERVFAFKKDDKFYTLRYENTETDFDKYDKAFTHIIHSLKLK
jgi:hypothetical protein